MESSMPVPSPDPLLRGLHLEREGRLSEAVDAYRESARLEPEGVAALVRLGLVLRQMGRDDEANDVFGKVLELHTVDAG
jgi:Flp pilus assembly protein TadD